MSEESTTPDLVELTRRQFEALNRRDLDPLMTAFAPNAVYDTSPDGVGLYEGPAAIRAFLGEWWDAFGELAFEPEDVLDLGYGVVFSVGCQKGRPAPTSTHCHPSPCCSPWQTVRMWASRLTTLSSLGRGTPSHARRPKMPSFASSVGVSAPRVPSR